jgi:hypothetical protein
VTSRHLCHSPTRHRYQQASFVHRLVEIFRLCLFKKICSKNLFLILEIQRKFLFNIEIHRKFLFILESLRNCYLFHKFNLVNFWLFYKLKEVHRIFLFIIEIHRKFLFILEIHRKIYCSVKKFKENSCSIKKFLVNTCLF